MNKVFISGLLGDNPKTFCNKGKQGAYFSLGVKNGKKTFWINSICFDEVAKHGLTLKKGMRVILEGKLQVREVQTPKGRSKHVTDVLVTCFETSYLKSDASLGLSR